MLKSWLLNQRPLTYPPRNKGLIAGLIKGNQWVFISPDHIGTPCDPTAGDQGDDSGTKSSKHQLVRERLLGEDDGGSILSKLGFKKHVNSPQMVVIVRDIFLFWRNLGWWFFFCWPDIWDLEWRKYNLRSHPQGPWKMGPPNPSPTVSVWEILRYPRVCGQDHWKVFGARVFVFKCWHGREFFQTWRKNCSNCLQKKLHIKR